PRLSSTEIVPAPKFAVAKSSRPSPFRSPAAIQAGLRPVGNAGPGEKLPSPRPYRNAISLRRLSATARSGFPSPLTSAIATPAGWPSPFTSRIATATASGGARSQRRNDGAEGELGNAATTKARAAPAQARRIAERRTARPCRDPTAAPRVLLQTRSIRPLS